jgi:hypothetical protein
MKLEENTKKECTGILLCLNDQIDEYNSNSRVTTHESQ